MAEKSKGGSPIIKAVSTGKMGSGIKTTGMGIAKPATGGKKGK